jgi:hypothetical protein
VPRGEQVRRDEPGDAGADDSDPARRRGGALVERCAGPLPVEDR